MSLGRLPKPFGRPPQSASEAGGYNNCQGTDRVMVEKCAKPIPPSEQELDNQGIRGLILIVGLGFAVWLAFGRKRRKLSDRDGRDRKRRNTEDC